MKTLSGIAHLAVLLSLAGCVATRVKTGSEPAPAPGDAPAAAAPAPVAAPPAEAQVSLPSGGPPLIRRSSTRARATLVTEIQRLEASVRAAADGSPERAARLAQLGDAYSELSAAALADARAATANGDADARAKALQIVRSASRQAVAQLTAASRVPSADSAAMLYALAVEQARADNLSEARKGLYDVIRQYPKSPFVADAYLLFGEFFAMEAAADTTKWDLARASFVKVLELGRDGNRSYCYAQLRASEILVKHFGRRDAAPGIRRALACADEVPKATGKALILANADALIRELGVGADEPGAPAVAALPSADVTAAAPAAPPAAAPAAALPGERRSALVIGNGAYDTGPLANPPRDADVVARALRTVGFDVDLQLNVDQAQLKRAITQLGDRLSRGGVGFFYYAGHGMQVNGTNYLIPVKARIQREQDVDVEAIALNRVLAEMDKAKNRVNIVALDACRDNPFARSFRSGARGLALSDAPMGTLISYATAPGSVASDGDGVNSPYAAALARNITRQGLQVEEVFKAVRREVKQATAQRQMPWESSSLEGNFVFRQ